MLDERKKMSCLDTFLDTLEISKEDIFRLVSTPIHVIDRQMRIIWRNKASKDIFTKEEGIYCYEIIAEKGSICDGCAVVEVLRDGIAQTKERKFKKMVLKVTIVPIFNKLNGVIVGVIETLEDKTATIIRQQKLEEMAVTDELTGIYNRRGIVNVLREEFARTERYKSMFSIALFDVDNFKPINDNYGHDMGDKVLVKLSSCAKNIIRDADKIGRYGGDEFLIILPETNLEEALNLTDRIKEEIDNCEFLPGIKATISIGTTQYFPGDGDIEIVLKRADDEMYKNKPK